jgi:hypothetical protein
MSMSSELSITPAAPYQSDRILFASAVARYTIRRRGELGLTVAAAAELSGLEVSEWCSLEAGWVPEELNRIRAIAAALEVCWTDLDLLAFFARCAQSSR